MLNSSPDNSEEYLRDLDLMARAVFTWVRQEAMDQRFLGAPVSDSEQSELAAGFLAGLQARLGLGDSDSTMVAYIYSIMRGERTGATRAARDLIRRSPAMAASCAGYLHGLNAALLMLGESHAGGDSEMVPEVSIEAERSYLRSVN
jgi:hypothetical protein